jgi:hypothetical protein
MILYMAGNGFSITFPGCSIVFLGGPECEPQIYEMAASIHRHIEYVYRLYGKEERYRIRNLSAVG